MRGLFGINPRLQKLKTRTIIAITALGLMLGGGVLAAAFVSTASALSPSVIYNNIPTSSPGNVPSEAFEATQTSEYGGQVQFAGTNRYNPVVTVLMSSWGCQQGNWFADNCVTTPGSTFSEPITLNIYNVNPDNSPGALVTTTTQTFNIPYRPSASTKCTGGEAGEWYSTKDKSCYNGFATPISFDFTGKNITLPDKAIIGVAYNTSGYGTVPYGYATACATTTAGCGYDSLNVGTNPSPSIGTALPTVNDAYLNSANAGQYCTGDTLGTGTFHLDAGCWTNYLPAFEVAATTTIPAPHITSPANGASLISADLTKVNWTSSNNLKAPVTYQYQSFLDAGYTDLAYSSSWLSTSEIPTPGTPIGHYYLQVRVQDGNGDISNWSNDASNPYEVSVVAPVPGPMTVANCQNGNWMTYNDPAFNSKWQCVNYVYKHSHRIHGDVSYTAYSLKRKANFSMTTATNSGYFNYSDANGSWYKVKVSSVSVFGNSGYFAGVVTKASNSSWVGLWLLAKVQQGSPDQIWGSFTDQLTAQNGVTNMTAPADGPFAVTKGNLVVN